MQLQKSKGIIIKEGHTSPGRSLGSTYDTQTNAGLNTKDKITQNQEKKMRSQEMEQKHSSNYYLL